MTERNLNPSSQATPIFRTLIFIAILGATTLVLFSCSQPQPTHEQPTSTATFPNAPYPPSAVIEEITWDWSTLSQAAPGSDLWPVTWAADNNIYTAWGDGGGFNGTNRDGRVALGFARIQGSPENYVGININGGMDAEFPPAFPGRGKTVGLLSVQGVLYAWINMQNSDVPAIKLAWSSDLGATWEVADWEFSSAAFAPGTFLQFGRDYAQARDDYIYFYGGRWGTVDTDVYLGRVLIERIKDPSHYEYFSGLTGNGIPLWSSDLEARRPVFADPNSTEPTGALETQVVFNPKLDRYILTTYHGGPGALGVFDGPEPWGPWTTVYYVNDFGGMTSGGEGLTSSFPVKWISDDGLTMWNVFSAWGDGAEEGVNGHDRFNLVRVTLKLRSENGNQ